MTEFDPRVTEAVEHVQTAAIELIKALRNALDVAEDLISAPSSPASADKPAAERVTRIRVE